MDISLILCGEIDKVLRYTCICIRYEWEKWYLHLGETQLHEVIYNIPSAIEDAREGMDVFRQ